MSCLVWEVGQEQVIELVCEENAKLRKCCNTGNYCEKGNGTGFNSRQEMMQ